MVAVGRTPRIGGHGRPSISVPFAPHDRNAALESNLMLQSADFSQLKSFQGNISPPLYILSLPSLVISYFPDTGKSKFLVIRHTSMSLVQMKLLSTPQPKPSLVKRQLEKSPPNQSPAKAPFSHIRVRLLLESAENNQWALYVARANTALRDFLEFVLNNDKSHKPDAQSKGRYNRYSTLKESKEPKKIFPSFNKTIGHAFKQGIRLLESSAAFFQQIGSLLLSTSADGGKKLSSRKSSTEHLPKMLTLEGGQDSNSEESIANSADEIKISFARAASGNTATLISDLNQTIADIFTMEEISGANDLSPLELYICLVRDHSAADKWYVGSLWSCLF